MLLLLWRTMAAVSWYLASRIRDPAAWSEAQLLTSPERTRMGLIEKLKVNVDFQIFDYEGKRVLAFDVKSRPIGLPVQYDGVAWIYEGDTLKPMSEDMRRSIYEETGGDFSGTICAGATIDDLDETAIENFRTKWIEKSGKKRLPRCLRSASP